MSHVTLQLGHKCLFLVVLRSEPNTALRALQLGALRVLHFRVTPKVTPLFATLPRQRPRGAARKENARTTEAATGARFGAVSLRLAVLHLSIDDGVDKRLCHFNEVNDRPPGAIVQRVRIAANAGG